MRCLSHTAKAWQSCNINSVSPSSSSSIKYSYLPILCPCFLIIYSQVRPDSQLGCHRSREHLQADNNGLLFQKDLEILSMTFRLGQDLNLLSVSTNGSQFARYKNPKKKDIIMLRISDQHLFLT